MPYTVPNQRTVHIHRERASANFLGIKNENWQAASRDLGAHALQLYLYLASNANGYALALSPADITATIGMARSTYHDQFRKLVNRGYLVQTGNSHYDFYETPQGQEKITENERSSFGQGDENGTSVGFGGANVANENTDANIEINNKAISPNRRINIQEEKQTEAAYWRAKTKQGGFKF